MVGEVFAGVSAFKAMLDIAKSLKDLSDVAARQRISIELQEQILAAQSAQTMLADQVSNLKAQLTKLETWEAEKQRYKLHRYQGGAFVYALKEDAQGGEPFHDICAACYQQGKKSILQRVVSNAASAALGMPARMRCSECKAEIAL